MEFDKTDVRFEIYAQKHPRGRLHVNACKIFWILQPGQKKNAIVKACPNGTASLWDFANKLPYPKYFANVHTETPPGVFWGVDFKSDVNFIEFYQI